MTLEILPHAPWGGKGEVILLARVHQPDSTSLPIDEWREEWRETDSSGDSTLRAIGGGTLSGPGGWFALLVPSCD